MPLMWPAGPSSSSSPTRTFALPDLHPLARGQVELLAGLHVEGCVPSVHVARGVGAELVRRVAVGDDGLALQGLAAFLAPALREGDEELLVAGEALLARPLLAAIG